MVASPTDRTDGWLVEDEEVLLLLHGVVLNLAQLRTAYASDGDLSTFKAMYQCEGDRFFDALRGEFSGVLLDKKADRWLVFTNQTGSRRGFFNVSEGVVTCASRPQDVARSLRRVDRSCSLDPVGAGMLLTYGFMLEDRTLLDEVKRLRPGCCLKVEQGAVSVEAYRVFDNVEDPSVSPGRAIGELDERFRNAVGLEYEWDRTAGRRHFATLSGGLDSRIALAAARQLGYQDVLCATFAESDCDDHKIANEIARDWGCGFLFQALDTGTFLTSTLEGAVQANGGTALYSGAAHALAMYRNLDFESFGVIHSGQLGDAVLGSYLTKPAHHPPSPENGGYSRLLFDLVRDAAEEVQQRYETHEMFLFYNRGLNGIMNGYWMAQEFQDVCSPFLDVDFLEFAFRIPAERRYKERIYLRWLLERYPECGGYRWANTGSLPRASEGLVAAKHFLRRVRQKLLSARRTDSMNPFWYWERTNSRLRDYVTARYRREAWRLEGYGELSAACTRMFEAGSLVEKTQVLTLLEALELYFPAEQADGEGHAASRP